MQVVSCGRGRARQMNAGWRLAKGEYLLFLHADSQLPDGYHASMQLELQRRKAQIGAVPRWVPP